MRARTYWSIFVGLILVSGLAICCISIWFRAFSLSDVAESHIQGNVPAGQDFRPFLIRDLPSYLKPRYGDKIAFDYEFLREGPTQTGIGFPYYYLWIKGTNSEGTTINAAVEVAAVSKLRFNITAFVPRQEIAAHPETLRDKFPELLIQSIYNKATNSVD